MECLDCGHTQRQHTSIGYAEEDGVAIYQCSILKCPCGRNGNYNGRGRYSYN